MARRSVEHDKDEAEDVTDVAAAREALKEGEGVVSLEEFVEREVGTLVEEPMIPFEIRKDGSVAHFTHEAAALVREVGA